MTLDEGKITLTVKDADMDKLYEALNDINIKESPYFEISDKYGNTARYYRNAPDTNVGDLISREDAVKIASGYCHPSNIAKELENLPSVNCSEFPNSWRPVSKETNPSTSGWYIVTCPEGMTASNERFSGIAEYNAVTGEWFDMDEPTDCYLAWMPLPEPWKGKRNEE